MRSGFIIDPFLHWIIIQFVRVLSALIAIGIIAVVAQVVLRAVAGCIGASMELCAKIAQAYAALGLCGQSVVMVILLISFCLIIYRSAYFMFMTCNKSEVRHE